MPQQTDVAHMQFVKCPGLLYRQQAGDGFMGISTLIWILGKAQLKGCRTAVLICIGSMSIGKSKVRLRVR